MITFDKETKTLIAHRLPLNTKTDMSLNILSDIQNSYEKFRTETVISDIKWLFEECWSKQLNKEYTAKVVVGELQSVGRESMYTSSYKYYPVNVFIYENGNLLPSMRDGYQILQIPYMDEYGKFTTSKGFKNCLSRLESANDISYDANAKSICVAMPRAKITINVDKNRIYLKARDAKGKPIKINIDELAQAMLYRQGDNTSIYEIGVSNYTRGHTSISKYVSAMGLASDTTSNIYRYMQSLKSIQYELHSTRDALNRYYSMQSAIGGITSRAIYDDNTGEEIIPMNHVVQFSDIIKLYKHRKNVIYIKNLDFYPDLYLNESIKLTAIPKGIRIPKDIKKHLRKYPNFLDTSLLNPEITEELISITYDKASPVEHYYDATHVLTKGQKLTRDIYDFIVSLCDLGYHENVIQCKSTPEKTTSSIPISLEREVVGNYFIRRQDLTPDSNFYDESKSESGSDWIYMFNAKAEEKTIDGRTATVYTNTDDDAINHITGHDLFAIFSDLCYINQTNKTKLLNRDESFLKKVLLPGDLFSRYLRSTGFKHFTAATCRRVLDAIKNGKTLTRQLTDKWIADMVRNNVMETSENINLAYEVSEACHIVTDVGGNKQRVVDSIRRLAIPYYGRICPFETPAGHKLGVVNTLAIGARIGEDGMLEAPFHKLMPKSSNGGLIISKEVTYLNPKDMLGNRFVDSFSLKYNSDGTIDETQNYLLLVPNPEPFGDPFVFSRTSGKDMYPERIDVGMNRGMFYCYVNVMPEQFLSPTACLVPFVASDDATRITYGLSQLKQSIYLQDSEKPLVSTFMYNNIFNFHTSSSIKSELSGVVTSVVPAKVTIKGWEKLNFSDRANKEYHLSLSPTDILLDGSETLVSDGSEVTKDTIIAKLKLTSIAEMKAASYIDSDGKLAITAGADGRILSAHKSFISLERERVIYMNNDSTTTKTILRVRQGDEVEPSTIIADVLAYPQPFLTRSPVNGIVKRVTANSVTIDTDTYVLKSPYDGVVEYVTSSRGGKAFKDSDPSTRYDIPVIGIRRKYGDSTRVENVSTREILFYERDDTTKSYSSYGEDVIGVEGVPDEEKHYSTPKILVAPGQTVHKGQTIAQKHEQDIDPLDYLVDPQNDSTHGTTLVSIPIKECRVMGMSVVFTNVHVSVGQMVEIGDIIASTNMSRDGVYTPSRNALVAYIPWGYNYEDGVVVTEDFSAKATSLTAGVLKRTIDTNTYKDPITEYNDNFNYCAPGEVIGKVVSKSNKNISNKKEMPIKATKKKFGMPFGCMISTDPSSGKQSAVYNLLGIDKLTKGDKMSGRHGNKGVVSAVIPTSKAPQLKNGMPVEIILNPHGVPNRMNVGQIWDPHLGLICVVLQLEQINSDSYNGATSDEVTRLMHMAWYIANTDESLMNIYNKPDVGIFMSNDFDEHINERRKSIQDLWKGVFNKDGTAYMYDPETDTYFNTPIMFGYTTYFKLEQTAVSKYNSRSGPLEEKYTVGSSQSLKDEAAGSNNGQRMGEMELMAMAGYGCSAVLEETLNEKSDNQGLAYNQLNSRLDLNGSVLTAPNTQSRAVDNLYYLLEAMGLEMDAPNDIYCKATTGTRNRVLIKKLISERQKPNRQSFDYSDIEEIERR